MIRSIAASVLLVSLLGACTTTTTTTASRPRLRDVAANQAYAANANSLNEPPPPAEGPEDVPAEGPGEVARNPGLVPTPLLRGSAASSP